MFNSQEVEYQRELAKIHAAEEAYWRRRDFLRKTYGSAAIDAYQNQVNQMSHQLLKQRQKFKERFGELPE